ncbi:unnamed protein product [Leptidea sinapis]|uniref:Uncharacterized protein n=1 Tax=Leptidea sinapis TaxID=189913 RepID=A0A5E4PML1_9NEOP|nr:unnamed protein product [Leptidea sinapis]
MASATAPTRPTARPPLLLRSSATCWSVTCGPTCRAAMVPSDTTATAPAPSSPRTGPASWPSSCTTACRTRPCLTTRLRRVR